MPLERHLSNRFTQPDLRLLRSLRAVVILFSFLAAISVGHAAQISTTWNGTGNWMDGAKWSNGVANNTIADTYSAVVASGSLSLANAVKISDFTNSGSMNLNAGASLLIDHGAQAGGYLTVSASGSLSTGEDFTSAGNVTITGVTALLTVGGSLRNLKGGAFYQSFGSMSDIAHDVENADDFLGVSLYDSSMTVHGNFLNATAQTTPQLAVNVNLYNQSTLTVSGDLVNNGDFTASSSQLTVNGRLRNSGDVTIEYAGTYHVANDATNSNYIRVSEINTVLQIDGSMDNTGRLHASDGGKISIGGTLAQQVNEVLTAGALAVGDDGSIEWSGASIKTVAKGASLQISKRGLFLDMMTGANALAALAENDGQIELDGGSIVTAGDFLNAGSLVGYYSGTSDSVRIGGDFTNTGTYYDAGSYVSSTGSTRVLGRLINNGSFSLSSGASGDFQGEVTNTGSFSVSSAKTRFTAASSFANLKDTTIQGGETSLIGGNLVNPGNLYLYDSNTKLEVTGDWTNAGYLYAGNGTRFTAHGALTQQVAGVLTSGFLRAEGTAVIEWKDADIQTIGTGAHITLSGTAGLRDVATGQDALANLSANNGALDLSAAATLNVGGFSNPGTTTVSGAQTAFHISGNLSNPGKMTASSGGKITVNGTLSEQVDGVLTDGDYSISSDSVIEWQGADVHTIGANASVSVSGSGQLRNIDNGASALALLENVDGKLVLGSSATISTSSDLSVTGRLQFSSPATLAVHGNLEFGDAAIFSGTFGYLYKNGIAVGLSTWSLNADEVVTLGGQIRLSLGFPFFGPAFSPNSSMSLLLLSGSEIDGAFSNAPMSGSRIALNDYQGRQIGTLEIQYGATTVTAGNFVAVPEPSVTTLIIGGLLFVSAGTMLEIRRPLFTWRR